MKERMKGSRVKERRRGGKEKRAKDRQEEGERPHSLSHPVCGLSSYHYFFFYSFKFMI